MKRNNSWSRSNRIGIIMTFENCWQTTISFLFFSKVFILIRMGQKTRRNETKLRSEKAQHRLASNDWLRPWRPEKRKKNHPKQFCLNSRMKCSSKYLLKCRFNCHLKCHSKCTRLVHRFYSPAYKNWFTFRRFLDQFVMKSS